MKLLLLILLISIIQPNSLSINCVHWYKSTLTKRHLNEIPDKDLQQTLESEKRLNEIYKGKAFCLSAEI